jgi:DNA-binding NarL/FixJ family response regulator
MTRDVTDRQREIIERLTRPGETQQAVADDLGISVQTVKNHLQAAYRTLGVRSIGQAARVLEERTFVR